MSTYNGADAGAIGLLNVSLWAALDLSGYGFVESVLLACARHANLYILVGPHLALARTVHVLCIPDIAAAHSMFRNGGNV